MVAVMCRQCGRVMRNIVVRDDGSALFQCRICGFEKKLFVVVEEVKT